MSSDLILTKSEYEQLLEEVKMLQARIAELTALRDDLLYHVCPALRAEYEEKIASLERELFAVQLYLRERQRTIEILQAQMNQRKKASVHQAEKEAQEESREYEEELNRRAKEAQEFRDRWEKESRWAEHDREEKSRKRQATEDTGENESSQDSTGQDQDAQGKTDESGYDQDDYGSAGQSKSAEKASASESIKSLYRKIVKRLHPDVHPNPTEREKTLLNQAHEAYSRGDLETIEAIWAELSGMSAPEEQYEDSVEGRKKLKELQEMLRQRLQALQGELDEIRSSFPYTMKSFLENEDAVTEKQDELTNQISRTRDMVQQLTDYIEELKKQAAED